MISQQVPSCIAASMDVQKQLDSIVWSQPWAPAAAGECTRRLLPQCREPEPLCDLQELEGSSNAFPIPFPVQTVRLAQLKLNTPLERLRRNAVSTYPLIHERVLALMANFLVYKKEYGSSIEKAMYKDMTIAGFIDRILQKRAITFMKAKDQYMLITGKKGVDGWEAVGTPAEKPPLVLADCLSYDEMKVSALVCVSGYTECINDGTRKNAAVPCDHGVQREAVIIGLIGPRFKRVNRMDYEDIIVSERQNRSENGYGGCGGGGVGGSDADAADAKRAWRKLWADFYQIPNLTHSELTSSVARPLPCSDTRVYSERWARVKGVAFDNLAYARRLQLVTDAALVEANARAEEAGKLAFLNVIGAGLGVWKMSPHQLDVFVLALVLRVRALLAAGALPAVADVSMAYIQPRKHVLALFQAASESSSEGTAPPKKLFLKDSSHPKGGINVQLESRQPSSELKGEHEGKLLVMTYPWDSNAHPGNEFWLGKLTTSGDPAAACATQVSELHNAHINPAVRGRRTRVAAQRLQLLPEHCLQ